MDIAKQREARRLANKKWYEKWYREKGLDYHKEYGSRPSTIKRIKSYRASDVYRIGVMLGNARRRARKTGVEFDLKREDLIVPDVCPIFGVKLRWGDKVGMPWSPSLDRIDPKRGYVRGNIAIMSFRANFIKNDGSADEHLAIAAFMKRKAA